jgi:hypothetical protein
MRPDITITGGHRWPEACMFTRCLIDRLQLTKRPALRTGRRLRLDLAFHALGAGSAALQLNRKH